MKKLTLILSLVLAVIFVSLTILNFHDGYSAERKIIS